MGSRGLTEMAVYPVFGDDSFGNDSFRKLIQYKQIDEQPKIRNQSGGNQ